ncbi:hypothetical protein BGX29_001550 [Mortierella sp. GBA35]|nr:hypothetical protein BGX29_001550 [Mortierella sp. GBA35]
MQTPNQPLGGDKGTDTPAASSIPVSGAVAASPTAILLPPVSFSAASSSVPASSMAPSPVPGLNAPSWLLTAASSTPSSTPTSSASTITASLTPTSIANPIRLDPSSLAAAAFLQPITSEAVLLLLLATDTGLANLTSSSMKRSTPATIPATTSPNESPPFQVPAVLNLSAPQLRNLCSTTRLQEEEDILLAEEVQIQEEPDVRGGDQEGRDLVQERVRRQWVAEQLEIRRTRKDQENLDACGALFDEEEGREKRRREEEEAKSPPRSFSAIPPMDESAASVVCSSLSNLVANQPNLTSLSPLSPLSSSDEEGRDATPAKDLSDQDQSTQETLNARRTRPNSPRYLSMLASSSDRPAILLATINEEDEEVDVEEIGQEVETDIVQSPSSGHHSPQAASPSSSSSSSPIPESAVRKGKRKRIEHEYEEEEEDDNAGEGSSTDEEVARQITEQYAEEEEELLCINATARYYAQSDEDLARQLHNEWNGESEDEQVDLVFQLSLKEADERLERESSSQGRRESRSPPVRPQCPSPSRRFFTSSQSTSSSPFQSSPLHVQTQPTPPRIQSASPAQFPAAVQEQLPQNKQTEDAAPPSSPSPLATIKEEEVEEHIDPNYFKRGRRGRVNGATATRRSVRIQERNIIVNALDINEKNK